MHRSVAFAVLHGLGTVRSVCSDKSFLVGVSWWRPPQLCQAASTLLHRRLAVSNTKNRGHRNVRRICLSPWYLFVLCDSLTDNCSFFRRPSQPHPHFYELDSSVITH